MKIIENVMRREDTSRFHPVGLNNGSNHFAKTCSTSAQFLPVHACRPDVNMYGYICIIFKV